MSLLVVDRSLDRLRRDFGVNRIFYICEKVDDFEYKIIQDINQGAHAETANTYYGAFVRQIPKGKGFILWLPGRKRYFEGVAFVFETGNGTAYTIPDLKEITNRLEADQFIYATYRDLFECLPWEELFLRGGPSFSAVQYTIDADDVSASDCRLRRAPAFSWFQHWTLDEMNFSRGTYHLVFASDPTLNEYYREQFSSTAVDLEFKEYCIDASDGQRCFLSKPLTSDDVLQLIKDGHPCTKLNEICLLSIRRSSTQGWSKFSKAMAAPFQHPDRILSPFVCFVKKVATLQNARLLARMFHLAQSTGTGKTMLCLHLIQACKRGIYCVYRHNDSTGYPPTTNWLESLIKLYKSSNYGEVEAVNLCLAFIHAAIEVFSSYADPAAIVKFYAANSNVYSAAFDEKFNDAVKICNAPGFATKVTELAKSNATGQCFPIVLDEWHELICYSRNRSRNTLSLYRAFRRAMIILKDTNVVAIFLGTKSSLNDFVLNYSIDPSARPDGIYLIKPYIFVHSLDVFALDSSALVPYRELFDNGKLKPVCLKKFAIGFGRPLWNAYPTFSAAVSSAQDKLIADKSIAMLTAFVMRTGAPVVPSCQLAHKLVLSGMATLEYVDVLGESCYVTYCAEPVLASAARLYCGTLGNLKDVLTKFTEYVDKRYLLDSGSSGEFVAPVILLRAMDCLAENCKNVDTEMCTSVTKEWMEDPVNNNVSSGSSSASSSADVANSFEVYDAEFPDYFAVKLEHFLKRLAGLTDAGIAALGLSRPMLDGLVNVNQFIACKRPYVLSQATLKEAFLRGVGLSLPVNWPGADLLIPVYRSDNLFSAIMIQVKNLDQSSIPGAQSELSTEIIEKLTAEYTLLEGALKDVVAGQEFAKIVFQFALLREGDRRTFNDLVQIRACKPGAGQGNVLWMLGLAGFKHLFAPEPIIEATSPTVDDSASALTSTLAATSISPRPNQPTRKSARITTIEETAAAAAIVHVPQNITPDAKIINDLQSILNNARDFVDSIKKDNVVVNRAQNTRKGIRSLLNHHIPLKTTNYLALLPPLQPDDSNSE